jgi:hypothetical protein
MLFGSRLRSGMGDPDATGALLPSGNSAPGFAGVADDQNDMPTASL